MLILSRKVNENIVIDGRIIVKVVRTEGKYVKLGIQAPPDVPVHRQEIYDEIQRANAAAVANGTAQAQFAASAANKPPAAPKNPAPAAPPPPPATGATSHPAQQGMLILSRKLNESIVIDGDTIVKILRIDRDNVKLGIQAPATKPVHRQEIYDAIQRNKRATMQQNNMPVQKQFTASAANAPAGAAANPQPPATGAAPQPAQPGPQ